MLHFFKLKCWLMCHNTKLANSVIYVNTCIAYRHHRYFPFVMITAVAFINHTHMICLDETEILKCTASWNNMCLVALWKLHCNTKRNKTSLSSLHIYFLCAS